MKNISNSTWILIAMVAGIVAGFFLGEKGAIFAPFSPRKNPATIPATMAIRIQVLLLIFFIDLLL